MPLSISNFKLSVPPKASGRLLIAGSLIAIAILSLIEFGLRFHGMKTQNLDTKELWAAQRVRASSLGKNALILVGASRIQLGIDLSIIGEELQLSPVQLAIDGTDFMPVLEDLASDPKISGTIIIDLATGAVGKSNQRFKSTEWVEFYKREYKGLYSPTLEKLIKAKFKDISNIYSSGIPIFKLLNNALGIEPIPKYYLITDENRERDADYSMVLQPNFYIARAIRHLGKNVIIEDGNSLEQVIQKIRDLIPPKSSQKRKPSDYAYISEITEKLKERGCNVIFVRFPTSGLCWEIDQAVLPKVNDWDQFANNIKATTIHFMDYPELQYELADGSHLDIKQKQEFTRSLARIISNKKSTLLQ